MNNKQFLSGNEAIARGAWEAGIHVACGYPGTPSTEIIENLARYEDVDVEWSTNEKVAFDVAYGASIAGARSLVSMKHVGVNVALDSLMVTPFSGVNGGFVVITADDPGMHSSQNEQDNRFFAKFAKIPMLEPSDCQEAKEFVKVAFDISEQFDVAVFLRTTTRTSHSKSIVEFSEPNRTPPQKYKQDPHKHVVPIWGKRWRNNIEERLKKLEEFAETFPFNAIEWNSKKIGVITSGICYEYAKEVFPDASFLKLGMIFPLPKKMIEYFCDGVEKIYVIEELEPFLEEQLRLLGVKNPFGLTNISGKDMFTNIFELSPDIVSRAFNGNGKQKNFESEITIPPRPPVMCPGCPHSGVYYVLHKLKTIVTGDIGCYTLGALPPFNALDTTFCMGSGIGNAFGMEKVHRNTMGKKLVAVIGDGTFLHSGIAPLIDIVFNKGITTIVLMDNSTTGMTGHQQHPGMGKTVRNLDTFAINYEQLIRAIGVNHIRVVDPYDLEETEAAMKEALALNEPAVVISRRPCVLIEEEKAKTRYPYEILDELCEECDLCLKIGCPAIDGSQSVPFISKERCIGCNLCAELCNFDAIRMIPTN
ncbi:MAG: indolepyruvate ferredoxin oxidoreductase subunit alpha [Ignavibacteriales bacterium]|nr:indolepyruvate ferredoxin oxidoreductase subunit alpha [Ignavibacteriales bacterium]